MYCALSRSAVVSTTLLAAVGGLSAKSDPDAEYEVDGLESESVSGSVRNVFIGAALTRSVILSKYTRRLRNTSYVVGQYLCMRLR